MLNEFKNIKENAEKSESLDIINIIVQFFLLNGYGIGY